MNLLIVGASAGLGRALSTEAARRGCGLLLAASDERDLEALSQHLRLTYGASVAYIVCDLAHPSAASDAIARAVADCPVDALLFPAGQACDDDDALLQGDAAERLLHINLTTQILLIAALWASLEKRPGAVIAGFGSIAAIRGRGRNVVYSAAKRGLQSFYESLMHKATGTTIRVRFYQVGYLDTPRNAGKKLLLPPGSPTAFACRILDSLGGASHSLAFYPGYWRFAAIILRMMPWFLYKKLQF